MNEHKLNRGRARLVHWLEQATEIAENGGGVYIAAIRDGLKANGTLANEEDVVKIYRVIQWIQGRVEANNAVNHAFRHATLTPNPDLAAEIRWLVEKLRRQWGFGLQPIEIRYGEPVRIGGVAWMTKKGPEK